MSGTKIAGLAAMIAVAFVTTAQAQTTPPPAPPPYATTKVEGTDNVYIFDTAAISRCSSSPRRA